MELTTEDIGKRFAYHEPKKKHQKMYSAIRSSGYKTADLINMLCPDCREKSLALTKLEECVMWANAAIARN